MSFQWTFLATFLYCELVVVILLLLPFIPPTWWQRFFKSRLARTFQAGAKYYFNFIICIFALLFADSIRELRKYAGVEVKDLSTPQAEAHAHMKQFRSQRNFYIAGFALFLWFVIKRLVNLLSDVAREMADSAAARKQAEGAHRHLEGLTSNDPTKRDSKDLPVPSAPAGRYIDPKEHDAEIKQLNQELLKAHEDIETLRGQYDKSIQQYDELNDENRTEFNFTTFQMEAKTTETKRPDIGQFLGFDHVVFWVGNAKQAASYYTTRFGFEYLAYQGLETGVRTVASHAVKNGRIVFVFATSYGPYENKDAEMAEHLAKHGDGVKDMALAVDDATKIYNVAVSRGAKSVRPPQKLTDEFGSVILATIQTYGDTVHTFVQRTVDGVEYKGVFLPGYKEHFLKDPINNVLPATNLDVIDHIVGNQPDHEMTPTAEWYEKMLDFHRFWSIDDKMMHTEYSALNSIVMADFDENVKLPINEPAPGKKKSQIQEYVDFYVGAGVQHLALRTENIIEAVAALRKRGVEFLPIPKSYYDNFRKALPNLSIQVKEDVDTIERLGLLIDYDDRGYLLQLFTKPLEDRPTVFIEIIQRRNFWGFGAGNFKSLFKALEDEQDKRGNLTDMNINVM